MQMLEEAESAFAAQRAQMLEEAGRARAQRQEAEAVADAIRLLSNASIKHLAKHALQLRLLSDKAEEALTEDERDEFNWELWSRPEYQDQGS